MTRIVVLLALALVAGCRLPERPARASVHVTVYASPIGTRVAVDANAEVK